MCLCLTLTVGLRNTNTIGHAYGISQLFVSFLRDNNSNRRNKFFLSFSGLAVTVVIFVTSFLMFLVMILVWKRKAIAAIAFLVFFGSVELVYVSASVLKVPQGGWIPLTLSIIFMSVMYIWYYGTWLKHEYDLQNKVSAERILASASKLGIVRVPGIGLVYTNLTTGVPAVFGHFAMNLPAFHQVLVFVCRKSVQVPFVPSNERFLVGRIGPKEHHMFRCIVRYGYKDLRQESYDFEDKLVSRIISFVEMEAGSTQQENRSYGFKVPDAASGNVSFSSTSFEDATLVRTGEFSLVDGVLQKEESMEILRAKESGVVYITGSSNAKAKGTSSLIKKFAIDVVFAFLSKNCRSTDIVRSEPHSLLLDVAMLYHV
ncbi:hypothetical protein HPP92_013783 [Vanilla planifolia]|uniref:Potassium transporter n=1 Tax=Vanilla planifolia TaxID=51239 RepID=A0A835QYE7_VANPL|nr:hypothetical protein HPP92_013783 [Vanilla planifolia]